MIRTGGKVNTVGAGGREKEGAKVDGDGKDPDADDARGRAGSFGGGCEADRAGAAALPDGSVSNKSTISFGLRVGDVSADFEVGALSICDKNKSSDFEKVVEGSDLAEEGSEVGTVGDSNIS